MVSPIAFYHNAKIQTFDDQFWENAQQPQSLKSNPQIEIFAKFWPCHFLYFIDPKFHTKFKKN